MGLFGTIADAKVAYVSGRNPDVCRCVLLPPVVGGESLYFHVCFPYFCRMKQNIDNFEIREYGRMELAAQYCRSIMPESAWKKFRRWMHLYPGLMERLRAIGYSERSRSFTPAQVRLIVEALGEP